MEKTLMVDGKAVKFKSTAALPRLYRILFKRDIIKDMQAIQKTLNVADADGENIPVLTLELFENVAYIMAKHADPEGIPASAEEWLDEFEAFSIYQVFPEIAELWQQNLIGLEESKKKFVPPHAK